MISNIPFGKHNEEVPYKTGDTDLENCASDGTSLFSYVSCAEDGGVPLPASVTVDNIVAHYSYKIFLPAERLVFVLVARDTATAGKFHIYEYNGASASNWTLIYTINPATYPYQSVFNPNFITFQVKQFSALVNETTKAYTLLMIFTNVGVFRYGYVAHSVFADTASTYIQDVTGWYLFDYFIEQTIDYTSYTLHDMYYHEQSTETSTVPVELDSLNRLSLAQINDASVADANKDFTDACYAICLAVIETIDGDLVMCNTRSITLPPSVTTHYKKLSLNLICNNATKIKKYLAYVKNVHYFIGFVKNQEELDNINLSNFYRFKSFSVANSINYIENNLDYYWKKYTGAPTTNIVLLVNATTYSVIEITKTTVFYESLSTFLGYAIQKTNEFGHKTVHGLPTRTTVSSKNFPFYLFNPFLYLKNSNSVLYQDILSNILINSKNFFVNDTDKLIYFTGFNGYGAANDRLMLSANLLKVQSDIIPLRLDNYESNLLIYGKDGISSVIFGDNFPASAYANTILKDVNIITKLCKTIKNILFVVTTDGIYTSSQNLLTSTFIALPEPISASIKTKLLNLLGSFINEPTNIWQYDAIIEQNSMVYVITWVYSGTTYIYGYSLLYKTWFKIKTGYSAKPVILGYSVYENTLLLIQGNVAGTDLTRLTTFFKKQIVIGTDNGTDDVQTAVYINAEDFDEEHFIKLNSIMLQYNISGSFTIDIAMSAQNTAFSSNIQLTLPSTTTIYKAFVKESGNVGYNSVYKLTFFNLQGYSVLIDFLKADIKKTLPKFR
jgi:hypothetical protein